ncbi:nucleotide-binding universal stress UspA family protein [Amycolatopsis lexingtonensis]|uniref:Nucleotide-binding universal stress UspA family protein n=1 Tax=Amycolatopsis lexingtonensis TaxID=218822 RepID=A0ABR9HXQ9_9PSEU|nr:universal stress protein [Amycolatopsis lexingtonensis]MBE1495720.1 nucleotide-binding universal stress UspA family protein [Amycolatopsis lexingtonensis]
MSATGNPPVVVAVDGSESAAAAALWAAGEAARRHASLLVFTAYGYEDTAFGGKVYPPSDWLAVKEAEADQLLRQTRATLEAAVPGLAVTTEASDRGPVPALLEVSGRARVLVTGEPVGVIAGLFSGSPDVDLAAKAHCPVVVVRGNESVDGPVVVGTDGSPLSEAAIAWAFEEASIRSAPLIALYTWHDGDTAGLFSDGNVAFQGESLRDSGRRLLAQRLAGWQEKYPDVAVERRVEHDKPRSRLLSASHGAQLVVVGSRGRGGFGGLVLGSTSQALIHHAACPVMVVRTENA